MDSELADLVLRLEQLYEAQSFVMGSRLYRTPYRTLLIEAIKREREQVEQSLNEMLAMRAGETVTVKA